jgi:hypothetical protein
VFAKYNIPLRISLLTGTAFLAFILFLFSHLCFGYDEYIWKTLYERLGFSGFFAHIYDSMSFRYSTHFYIYLTFNFADPGTYRLFVFISQLFTFSVLLVSLYSIYRTVFRAWLQMNVSRWQLLASSLITGASLYYLTSQIVEIYTYTSSYYSYFMPVAFFCLGLSCVISEKKTGWILVLLFIASFSVGGSSENVSASFIACIGVFFVFQLFKLKRRVFSDPRMRKLFVFILLTSVFALIAYTAPGARNRAAGEAANALLKSNELFAPHRPDVFLQKYFHLSNLVGLLLLSWFVYLGHFVPQQKFALVKRIFIQCSIAFVVSVLIHLLITKVIFDSFGYLRIWFPVNFHMCMLLVSGLFYAGTKARASAAAAISSFGGLICLCFLVLYTFRHYPKVTSFSELYFARREEVIENCTKSGDQLYISRQLPDPDILYFDKFVRLPKDSLTVYYCVFNEIPCKNVYIK